MRFIKLQADRLVSLLAAVIATAVLAVAPARAADAPSGDAAWDAGVARFIEGHFAANPVTAVYAGRHDFDGRLPDLSDAALRGDVARIEAERARLVAVDASQLSESRQRERAYLLAALDVDLFWKKEADWPRRNPAFYLGLLDPEIYLSKPYASLETRMRAYIAYAREIPRAARQIRANLRTPMPAPWIEYGVNAFSGFAQFYGNDVAAVFASVKDPALQAQLADANKAAAKSMQELADWLVCRTQERDPGLRARPAALRAHGRGDRAGQRTARAAAADRPGGHGPQPRFAAEGVRRFRARQDAA